MSIAMLHIEASVEKALLEGDLPVAAERLVLGLRSEPLRDEFLRLAVRVHRSLHPVAEVIEAEVIEAEVIETVEGHGAGSVELAGVGSWLLSENLPAPAEHFLRQAVVLDTANPVYRHLWLAALNQLAQYDEALRQSIRRVRYSLGDVNEAQDCLSAAMGGRRYGLALLIISRAERHFGKIAQFDLTRVQALSALERYKEALLHLDDMDRTGESDFIASVVLATTRDYERALEMIESACEAEPDNIVYLTHRIAVLGCLNRHAEGAALYDALSLEQNEDMPTLRTAFAVYVEAGRYEQAVRVGAKIISADPDDITFSSVYQTVLGKHIYVNLLSQSIKAEPRRRQGQGTSTLTQQVGFPAHLIQTGRSIGALIRREMKTRFGRARLGYLWVVFEPLAHIGIMILLVSSFNHSGNPPIGPNFAVFYFTGIIPFHLFTHTAGHMMGAAPENRPLLQLPRVRLPDIFAARAILEGITELLVAFILLLSFVLVGLEAFPIEPLGVLGALLVIWIAAYGMGIINAAISSCFAGWERIWGAITSIIYFSSGTFFIPRMMPVAVRDVLAWNPVLQGIELVRVYYFHEPRPEWLSARYLIGLSISLLAIGLITERIMRRRMLEIE